MSVPASDAEVWPLRSRWPEAKVALAAALRDGRFDFGPMERVRRADGRCIHLWSAIDALVLKALTIVLREVLPSSRRCTHIEGHGGAKGAVRAVAEALPAHRFVMRTDVRAFYESIDQALLYDALCEHVPVPVPVPSSSESRVRVHSGRGSERMCGTRKLLTPELSSGESATRGPDVVGRALVRHLPSQPHTLENVSGAVLADSLASGSAGAIDTGHGARQEIHRWQWRVQRGNRSTDP